MFAGRRHHHLLYRQLKHLIVLRNYDLLKINRTINRTNERIQ
jgi:hypothetical protein